MSKKLQSGSLLHILLLAMIIVVIVIALGMLFWQNIRDEPMIDASGAVSDAISENAQQPADSQNLLSIELSNWEWMQNMWITAFS